MSKALSHWSKIIIGDIFEEAKSFEKKIEGGEQMLQEDDNANDRNEVNKLKAEYTMHINKVHSFWKQKARVQWSE